MRDIFINSLLEHARKDKNIVLITGDLGFGVLNKFVEELPNQYINAGVSEQNMTGMAAGLALEGKKVFTYSIANFATIRCLEQIRNDVVYHQLPVNIIAVGGGLAYGALGMSHHAIEDIAIMRSLPGLRVFAPCDEIETLSILDIIVNNPSPSYIRIDKPNNNNLSGESFDYGKLRKIKDGNDIAIIGYGSVLEEAVEASNLLAKKNIHCSIYSIHTLKPYNKNALSEILKKYDKILIIEEHVQVGGLSSLISEVLVEVKIAPSIITKLNLGDQYSLSIGSRDHLRTHHKIDSKSIFSAVSEMYE